MESITLQISGMACGGCANSVEKALLALSGMIAAEVSHTDGIARISFDPATTRKHDIEAAIKAAGFDIR